MRFLPGLAPEFASRDDPRVPLAVLGDSDSHAYHDSLWFPPGTAERGGAFHDVTFQWTELLVRLRGHELDLGRWGVHGWPPRVARVAAWFGGRLQSPRKRDFAFNFAVSGAGCEHLMAPRGQVAPLLRHLEAVPARWAHGVVVIRIGINDLGTPEVLQQVAAEGLTPSVRARLDACTAAIGTAVRAVRQVNGSTRIVLVGLFDNANWPPNLAAFRSAEAQVRLAALLDGFDGALRELATSVPNTWFVDDRAFFRARWGARAADGTPSYRPATIGGVSVGVSQGDAIEHLVVMDGHAGTLVNLAWAQQLLALLAGPAGLPVTPLTEAEVEAFVRALRAASP
jgi:hypothetical protein